MFRAAVCGKYTALLSLITVSVVSRYTIAACSTMLRETKARPDHKYCIAVLGTPRIGKMYLISMGKIRQMTRLLTDPGQFVDKLFMDEYRQTTHQSYDTLCSSSASQTRRRAAQIDGLSRCTCPVCPLVDAFPDIVWPTVGFLPHSSLRIGDASGIHMLPCA